MDGNSMGVGIGIAVILLFLLFYMIVLAYAVVAYVLGSKGLYAIAVRRGIKNPWMAWIPVANSWILGCVSDQYQQCKYGEDPNLRKKLLIFSIITGGSSVSCSFGSFSLNLNFGDLSGPVSGFSDMELSGVGQIVLIVFLVVMLMLAIAGLVLSIIQTVYQCKAYYSLYASCKPQFAVLFLVLLILTPAGPFLTYACRNSDDGMPVQTEV